MLHRKSRSRRRAAVIVESAIVLPLLVLLILGLIIGGMGIFRYQEVAGMAREAARYASVRGADYQSDVKDAKAATEDEIFEKVIKPRAAAMNLTRLKCKVDWDPPDIRTPLSLKDDYAKPQATTVTVTVTYTWIPEAYLTGPIVLSSSSTMVLAY